MIPDLEDGVLPAGVHDATAGEVAAAFGRFQRTDRRMGLTARLLAYLADAKRSGLVSAVVIDGSYVTALDEPEDIDLIVVVRAGVDLSALRPFEYNAVSKRMIRQLYRFDAYAYPETAGEYARMLDFFQDVNPHKHVGLTSRLRKGVVRVVL